MQHGAGNGLGAERGKTENKLSEENPFSCPGNRGDSSACARNPRNNSDISLSSINIWNIAFFSSFWNKYYSIFLNSTGPSGGHVCKL